MSTKNKAIEYILTQGYSLFPISNTTRKPLINWKQYQDRLPTDAEIETWWEQHSDAGIGVVTGKVSQITVIDIDVKNRDVHMSPDDFPPTLTIRTRSGGWHLYYEYYEGIANSADGWEGLPGVDIRNNGGFVVAPPTDGYEVIKPLPLAQFPKGQFVTKRKGPSGKFSLSSKVAVSSGGRNMAIASVIGSLLHGVPEDQWVKELWPVVLQINQTYSPPLPLDEVQRTFESIASKEKSERTSLGKTMESVRSPIQFDDNEQAEMKLRSSKNGIVIKDKLNALIALSTHTDWADAFKYDEFQRVILFKGKPMKEHNILQTQTWLQGEMAMAGLAKNIVADAIEERAHIMSFDSAVDWLKSLTWDGEARLDSWLSKVYHVDDSAYYQAIGNNWLRAVVRRAVYPGSKFDHVLVVQGGQGVRKSTSFAALGQGWHVETAIKADDKDFIMQFDGKAIVEFSEGGTLSHSDTKILKSIITRTNDKYRAPYARMAEEHPRRCVFCMTTNEGQYLKDETGNRRWWILQMPEGADCNVEWIEENRDQLFAEAYARRDEAWVEVPKDISERMQEESRIIDDIEDKVLRWYERKPQNVRDDGITPWMFFESLYIGKEDKTPATIPWNIEIKIKSAFVSALGLKYAQKRIGNERARRYFPTAKTTSVEIIKGLEY